MLMLPCDHRPVRDDQAVRLATPADVDAIVDVASTAQQDDGVTVDHSLHHHRALGVGRETPSRRSAGLLTGPHGAG